MRRVTEDAGFLIGRAFRLSDKSACSFFLAVVVFAVFTGTYTTDAKSFHLTGLPGDAGISLEIGFNGIFRHGYWTPIRIDVLARNEPLEGQLIFRIPSAHLLSSQPSYTHVSVPIDLPAGHQRRQWVNWPLLGIPYPLEIAFADSSEREIATYAFDLRQAATDGPIILVLDPEGQSWAWLGDASTEESTTLPSRRLGVEGTAVSYVYRPEDVPSQAMALIALTAVIVRDTFPLEGLSTRQSEEMLAYVRQGGHLVLVGGSTPPKLPATWRRWLTTDLGEGVTSWHFHQSETSTPAWQLVPEASSTAIEVGTRSFLVSERIGDGRVTFLAADPTTFPDNLGHELLPALKELIVSNDDRPPIPAANLSDRPMWDLAANLDVSPGSTRWLTWYLGLYVAAFTCVLAMGVRRPWLHTVLPLLLLAGSLGSIWYARSIGLRDPIVYGEIQITQGISQDMALRRSYLIVAARSGDIKPIIGDDQGPLPYPPWSPLGTPSFLSIEQGTLAIDDMSPFATQHLYFDRLIDAEIWVTVHYFGPPPDRRDIDRIEVENASGSTLRHAHYISSNRIVALGDIPSGERMVWRDVAEKYSSPGWMGMTLQSLLQRLDPEERPSLADIRLLGAAADRMLDQRSQMSSARDDPFLMALAEPRESVVRTPWGRTSYRHVVIVPVIETHTPGWSGLR